MKNLKHIFGAAAFLAVAVFLLSSDAFCQSAAPKITLEAESNKVGVGEVLPVSIEISTENDKPQKVTLPAFDGFDVFSKSVSSPLQFSFGIGQGVKMTYTTRYDLGLMAKTVGSHKIGPVVVKMGGKEYESDTIVVQVTKEPQGLGKKQPDWPGGPFGVDPFKDFDDIFKRQFDRLPTPDVQPPVEAPPGTGLPPEGLDGAKYDPNVFVRTVVTPMKIYMGQQATLDFYVYSRVNVTNIDVTKEPAGGKFWTKDLMPPTGKVDFSPIDVGGVTFSVATLRKIAIFPTEAGQQPISPAEVTISTGLGGIFGGETYKRSGVPVGVEVIPLPAEGRPEGFDPSNVGKFTIEIKLKPQNAVVDQPLPVQFIISGTGNIEMVRPPEMAFPPDVKAYDPQITDSVEVRHFVIGGKKTIEYIIIPTKPGKLVIPAVKFAFFDPEAGKYFVAASNPVEINVAPAAPGGQGPIVEGSGIQESGDEEDGTIQGLRSIITVAPLRPPSSQYIRSRWFIWAIAVPPAILCILLILSLLRYSAARMKTRNPSTRAMGEARRILKGSTTAKDREVFYGKIQKAIYQFIEQRFGVAASGMTSAELKKSLGDLQVDARDVEGLIGELENCEFARYGRSTDVDDDIRGCAGRVESILEKIDRQTGKNGKNGKKNSAKGGGLGAATTALFLAALFFAPPSAAENVRQTFDQANDLYFKGDYRGAIEKYYRIVNLGIEDTAVYFNTGDAFAKMGEYGKAIYFYEKVLKIKPRDSSTQKNLSIVRATLARQISNKEKDVSLRPRETVWEGAVSWFSPNELVVIFLFFYYLFFVVLLARRFMKRPVARIGVSIAVVFFLAMWILSGAMVLLKYRVDFLRREGVVVDKGLVVSREGPTPDSGRKFDVIEGQRIRILEARGQWFKIEDEKKRIGWLQRSQIGIL